MVQNKAFIYKAVPNGWPVPGKDLTVEDIGFDENAAPPPKGVSCPIPGKKPGSPLQRQTRAIRPHGDNALPLSTGIVFTLGFQTRYVT
jgi:hypothetical protein